MTCIVKHCKSTWTPKSDIKFHSFPKDEVRRRHWLSIVHIKGRFSDSSRICSLHFKAEEYDQNKLKNNATPFFLPRDCGCECCDATEFPAGSSSSSASTMHNDTQPSSSTTGTTVETVDIRIFSRQNSKEPRPSSSKTDMYADTDDGIYENYYSNDPVVTEMSSPGVKPARSQEYRAGLTQFIAAYRAQPCLWQVRHKDYYNREKRSLAMDAVVRRLRLVEPGATRDDALRKINSLRSIYKKEHRKVMEAKRAGEERVVTLWCYDLMRFIDRRLHKDGEGADDGEGEDDEGEVEEVADEHSGEVLFIKEDVEYEGNESNDYNGLEVGNAKTEALEETLEDEEEIEIPAKQPRLAYAQSEASHSGTEARAEDCHDAYCRSVAWKLRGLARAQRLLAERLINDVLFEAECGQLARDHRLARPAPPPHPPSPPPPPREGGILWTQLTRDQDNNTPTLSVFKTE